MEGGENSDNGTKLELEDQFVLRLPSKQAEQVRRILKTKPKKLRKALLIDLDPEAKTGKVIVNKRQLDAKLVTLPTVIESCKTVDKVNLFKAADVSQMLICGGEEEKVAAAPVEFLHGLTPPLKNVRKFRFRKTVKNKGDLQEAAEIEKEIVYLLRMDFEAVSTKYEIYYEEPKAVAKRDDISEHSIFGGLISDSNSDQGTLRPKSNEIITGAYLSDLLDGLSMSVRTNHSTAISGAHDVNMIDIGLYLGDMYVAKDRQFLVRNGFTHVVNAAEGADLYQVNTNEYYYKNAKIKYLGIPGNDRPSWNMSVYFETAARFIDDAVKSGGKVLVHCVVGISRSATLVIAYLMICKNMNAAEALVHVFKRRRVFPNIGFLHQLAQLSIDLNRRKSGSGIGYLT